MKVRIVAMLGLLVGLIVAGVTPAQASVAPVLAVDSFFAALNAGNHETAVATFTPDAVATLARGETYRGRDGMLRLVQLMEHPGRHHELVQAYMSGNTVRVVVEISDRGIRWGEQTIVVEVRGSKLHTFTEQSLRVQPGS